MTRIERLKPVVSHTDKKERQALQAMAICKNELEMELKKVEQLETYKTEYLNKQSQINMTYSSLELREFKRFIDQLDQTINQQGDIVEKRRQALDHKRKTWQSTRINSKVMHKVVDNLNKAERLQEDKIEQKVMDELSQRKTLK
ncbi:MAG: flagellar FliJ protein [Urechidicola sp.]|jgi:flagellar FliJ protein